MLSSGVGFYHCTMAVFGRQYDLWMFCVAGAGYVDTLGAGHLAGRGFGSGIWQFLVQLGPIGPTCPHQLGPSVSPVSFAPNLPVLCFPVPPRLLMHSVDVCSRLGVCACGIQNMKAFGSQDVNISLPFSTHGIPCVWHHQKLPCAKKYVAI